MNRHSGNGIQNPNNEIEFVDTKKMHIKNVKLNLPMQTRYIGYVDTNQRKLVTTRKKKHLFRKTESLGLNANLLTSGTNYFDWICIDYEGMTYKTSVEYFMAKGHFYCFQSKGFEAQYFLPLEEFGLDKAIDYRKRICEQGELFSSAA